MNKNDLNYLVETYIYNFFRLEPFGWVEIDLNYALISIERLMPTCSDRGKFKILATHDVASPDKCYIDHQDGFPRYYYNFDCMIKELCGFINSRPILEIDEIMCCYNEKRESIQDYMCNMLNKENNANVT